MQICCLYLPSLNSGLRVCETTKRLATEVWRQYTFTHSFFSSFFSHLNTHLFPSPLCSSPWRLCGPQPGPRSPFCPADRSRLFSTRCRSSETCTRASTPAWRTGWVRTTRLRQTQGRRERRATQALSWWWETCSWKWWVFYRVKWTNCVKNAKKLRKKVNNLSQKQKENWILKGRSFNFNSRFYFYIFFYAENICNFSSRSLQGGSCNMAAM